MKRHADVIVVGLGTAGAATCMTLARRGVVVLGLDAYRPPHTMGSHHGRSRSVRRAYLEGTVYLPMALKAWELWRRLETDAGERLLVTTGNLTLGPMDGPALSGFLTSARSGRIAHELLSASDVRRRWPALTPPEEFGGGLETEAGIAFPERGIAVFLRLAAAAGAVLRFDEPVIRWSRAGDGIVVRTASGSYTAGRLLIAAGARSGRLVGRLGAWLTPKRVPVHWIDPPDGRPFALGRWPVTFWQVPGNDPAVPWIEFYTLPTLDGHGPVKAAFHHPLDDVDPYGPLPAAASGDVNRMRSMLKRFVPTLADRPMVTETCLYTLTPDQHFVIGALPEDDNAFTVALAGHGFKFAPVLGELLSDLIQGRRPSIDISFFAPKRLAPGR